MRELPNLVPRMIADLGEELGTSAARIAFGVSCDGPTLAVARPSNESVHEARGPARLPKSRLARPASQLVVSWREGEVRRLELHDERLAASFVQPMGSDVLLVGSR